MSKADALDLLGVCLLALMAFAIYAPLALGVVGVAALVAGKAAS